MTKHNTKNPQRRAEPRAAELASEIRKRFAGSTNIHEEGLEFIYLQTRRLNVVERDRVLAALTGPGRDQYAAYRARRDREEFEKHQAARDANRRPAKAQGGNVAAVVPPVGSVGPITRSAAPRLPRTQRPGEDFGAYLSRISTVSSPGFDAHVAKPRPLKNYGPGGVLPASALPHTIDEGMIGGSAPRIELSARARDLLASMSAPGVPWQDMGRAPGSGVSVRAWIVPEEDLDGAMLRIVDRNGRARRYPWELAQRAHSAALDLVREEDELSRGERSRAAQAVREASGGFATPGSAEYKRQDNYAALHRLVREIEAAAHVLTARQRRKLERLAPDLADAVKRAERAARIIGGAKRGN